MIWIWYSQPVRFAGSKVKCFKGLNGFHQRLFEGMYMGIFMAEYIEGIYIYIIGELRLCPNVSGTKSNPQGI